MDDSIREDQNGLLSVILRNFHSTLCGYNFAGKELVSLKLLRCVFLSLYKKRSFTKIPEILLS